MSYGKMLNQYTKTNVETAGKVDLIIMCYEKAIQLLSRSRTHFEENQLEQKARTLQNAMDLINELRCSLDFEKGGKIATNLDAIYGYITKSLLMGDVKMDLSTFDEAIRILTQLKEAWERVASDKLDQSEAVPVTAQTGTNTEQLAA
jgi:flagellar protein FliS